ncbi:recombinase RecQ, partial [Staphylococcus gallinarum]
IFENTYQRKRNGYIRMLGYKNLDQCRRAYLMEFFGEFVNERPEKCCDNDADIELIKIFNRKKVKRKIDYNEKLKNLFK